MLREGNRSLRVLPAWRRIIVSVIVSVIIALRIISFAKLSNIDLKKNFFVSRNLQPVNGRSHHAVALTLESKVGIQSVGQIETYPIIIDQGGGY